MRSCLAAALALSLIVLGGCARQETLEPVVLSLDWVPNTNHTGFYVALEKGWYAEEGLAVDIQVPSDASAALKQVAAGNTPFGVSFEDEVTVARSNGIPVVSIAAIVQHNTSAIASLKSSGITSAADFEGKTYASFGLPIERPLLQGLMQCAGADINKLAFVDVGYDTFPALVAGRADLIWIYEGWDGVQAKLKGIELNMVPFYGDCVPDYYTPVIIAGENTLAEHPDLARRFLKATARGYEYAIAHPAEAADMLLKHSPESDPALVRASQEYLSAQYQADADHWGVQKPEVWRTFAAWMADNGLLTTPIDADAAFSNDYLPD